MYEDSIRDFSREKIIHTQSAIQSQLIIDVTRQNYAVGDILIREVRECGGVWSTEKIGISNFNRKYLVIHVDHYGIPHLSKIAHNKTLGKPFYVANCDLRWQRWVIDPEFANHIILGNDRGSYNPMENYLRGGK